MWAAVRQDASVAKIMFATVRPTFVSTEKCEIQIAIRSCRVVAALILIIVVRGREPVVRKKTEKRKRRIRNEVVVRKP